MTLQRSIILTSLAVLLTAPVLAHGLSEEVDEIAELLRLRSGMHLADVGGGDGEFGEELAERVGPGGHVYINEIDDGELRRIRRRVDRSELGNMSAVEGGATDTNLPDRSCDGILLRYVYHHFSEREEMRASLRRSLRPGGILVVIEKLENDGHGVALDEIVDEISGDGFRLISRHPSWGGHDDHHAAVFARLP